MAEDKNIKKDNKNSNKNSDNNPQKKENNNVVKNIIDKYELIKHELEIPTKRAFLKEFVRTDITKEEMKEVKSKLSIVYNESMHKLYGYPDWDNKKEQRDYEFIIGALDVKCDNNKLRKIIGQINNNKLRENITNLI